MGKFVFSFTGIGEALSAWEQANKIFVDGMEYVPVTVIDVLLEAMVEIANAAKSIVAGGFITLLLIALLAEAYAEIRYHRKRREKEEKSVSTRN